jgi:type II secretory pathway pseudopilin PulG
MKSNAPSDGGRGSPARSFSAFTLIELLAVIALIVLLMSLLLPSLGRARGQAHHVGCMSNVRQVTAAIISYSSDNEAHPPDPGWRWSDPAQRGWLYSSNLMDKVVHLETGTLWPYLRSYAIYRCPGDKQPNEDASNPDQVFNRPNNSRMITSYNMNGSLCWYGKQPFDFAKHEFFTHTIGEFKPSDIIFWEGDEATDVKGWWWDSANFPHEGISSRHDGYGTVASIDGHVEKMSTNAYYAINADSKKNRLWNAPQSANGH